MSDEELNQVQQKALDEVKKDEPTIASIVGAALAGIQRDVVLSDVDMGFVLLEMRLRIASVLRSLDVKLHENHMKYEKAAFPEVGLEGVTVH